MKPPRTYQTNCGLTLIEVLVVIAIIVILGFLLFPGAPRHGSALTVRCMSNLKQIGIAELMWAYDNTNALSSRVSTNLGGSMEYLQNGRVDLHFQTLGPYTPQLTQLVHCPTDKRNPASDPAQLTNTNISYFASLDPVITNAGSVVAGDCNFEINGRVTHSGVATWAAANNVTWGPGLHSRGSNSRGNLLFADGHVEHLFQASLPKLTQQLGTNANRFAFP
jgi:prepilin-type N-terminal cleavage/methylation domain-containing protein/prepilin-type processing-associated H-X9-DG protein